mmetsp:Transcript_88935/g.226328  ORF Transcript_88935/g.226328 Transcript_88935/m.226328 type:complete len:274 (+) Transcript_88935:131-952(+)
MLGPLGGGVPIPPAAGAAAHALSTACRQARSKSLNLAVVLFPGFELLDVAAPGELLGAKPELVTLTYCALAPGPVASSCMELRGGAQGPSLLATHSLQKGGLISKSPSPGGASESGDGEPFKPHGILVPGGKGVRSEVQNLALLQWLREAALGSEVIFTICTGSWLLGAAGGLDTVSATSNKAALRDGHPQRAAPQVQWQMNARWVEHERVLEDGVSQLVITSSGVSAGGDAALALLARLGGLEVAHQVAHAAEWSWQEDSTIDPFAKAYGLS